ncbi:MAG: ATP-binding protein [Kiritimatiellae bacterium]|nr:ATP-binding protein [Kiritimatiellia bacterium]
MFPVLPFLAAIATVSELRRAVWDDNTCLNQPFSITCTVAHAINPIRSFSVYDGTGYCNVRTTNDISLHAGDYIRINGRIGIDPYNWQRAFMESAEKLGTRDNPGPIEATPDQLHNGFFDNRTVVMHGIVSDVVNDEIDPMWRFLVLRHEKGSFLAAVCIAQRGSGDLDRLIGATVSITGSAHVMPDGGKRKFKTPQLTVSTPDNIRIISPAPQDPFAVPQIPFNRHGIANFQYKSASMLSRMNRHRAEGRVIAVLKDRNLLLKTGNGQTVGARIDSGPMPSIGDDIIVAGFPETDLFIVKLAGAVYKKTQNENNAAKEPETAIDLSSDFDMNTVLRENYGRLVRITGRVVAPNPSKDGSAPTTIAVSCGRHIIPIDITSCKNLTAIPSYGDTISATGYCVINTTKWNPLDIFPRIDGFTLAPRSPDDLRILSSAPWWTAGKLMVVIAALLVLLTAVFIWNRFLRIMIERRSRQLFKAEIEQAKSCLRVDERTRLSVELHDAISQMLTGVAFQVDAAEKTLSTDPAATGNYLSVARRTLLSCREELRRCIWDLRNDTLNSSNFAAALQKTLAPCTGTAVLSIRFPLRRALISDTTAHAVMNIIRELSVNAVRHGYARHIWIAGEHKDNAIRFSVKDDGAGFVPENRPGPTQGHFGLQGVKERVAKLGGSLTIKSEIGKGSKIIVEIGK